jgi:hypothetical protein
MDQRKPIKMRLDIYQQVCTILAATFEEAGKEWEKKREPDKQEIWQKIEEARYEAFAEGIPSEMFNEA